MSTYKSPGVYTKEIALFPPSVAEVGTAIPAFVGYTEKALRNGTSLRLQPTRIKSVLEYIQYFGEAATPSAVKVTLTGDQVESATIEGRHYLYDSIRIFYANGGGACYVVSVGDYGSVKKKDLQDGLAALKKEDEPTMLCIPEVMLLADEDIADVQQQMLAQCEDLQDRVALLDVKCVSPDEKEVMGQAADFRNGIGMKGLKYGAAYYPFLRTTLPFDVRYNHITFWKGKNKVDLADLLSTPAEKALVEQLTKAIRDADALGEVESARSPGGYPRYFANVSPADSGKRAEILHLNSVTSELAEKLRTCFGRLQSDPLRQMVDGPSGTVLQELEQKLAELGKKHAGAGPRPAPPEPKKPESEGAGTAGSKASSPETPKGAQPAMDAETVQDARETYQKLFTTLQLTYTSMKDAADQLVKSQEENVIKTIPLLQQAFEAVKREAAVLPPTPAVAGAIAYVDASRGVHKAPANVSLSSVVEPVVKLDSSDQDHLNVDTEAGKSINAIRSFSGRGPLIWGARTLAGNDNEWRYLSVRRFFNMVEESIKKSTQWAVFEPNDANTWVKVTGMIQSYLTLQWRAGALAGSKPEEAFFVKLGLGVTMTPVDVLEGRMNVEIGMAAVRPAEFILLKFSHKMQTS